MTEGSDTFHPPRPWHLVLSPVLPVLALVAGGLAMVDPRVALWTMTITASLAVFSWVVLSLFVGNARTAALVVSVLSVVGLSQASVAKLAGYVHIPHLIPLISVWAVLLCGFILRFGGRAEKATTFANVLMVSATALVSWPIVTSLAQPAALLPLTRSSVSVPNAGGVVARPDVYILILDGYGRADILRERYRFDNDLIENLQSAGFFVAAQASSNYAQTAQSLASALNLDYLPLLTEPLTSAVRARRSFVKLIAENRTFSTFAKAGYRIRAYASEYSAIRPREVDDRPHPFVYLTEFEYGVYQASILPQLSLALGYPSGWAPMALHRRHVNWTLNHLEQTLPQASDPPTLVFAHLLIPHPPFAFEADGAPRSSRLPGNLSDGDHWQMQARNTSEKYETGYVDSIKFLNSRLVRIIRGVLNRRDGRRTIFYIQADHGPGSRLHWEDPGATDYRERFGIMLAVRLPDGYSEQMYPTITPVNAVRVVLNDALGTHLSLLEDRSYFSRWTQPFEFIDVTDRIR